MPYQVDEAGEKLSAHLALFPTLGVDAFRKSKFNLRMLAHSQHMSAHRLIRTQEEVLQSLAPGRAVKNTAVTS